MESSNRTKIREQLNSMYDEYLKNDWTSIENQPQGTNFVSRFYHEKPIDTYSQIYGGCDCNGGRYFGLGKCQVKYKKQMPKLGAGSSHDIEMV